MKAFRLAMVTASGLCGLLLATIASGATAARPNWDRAYWKMDDPGFFAAYPAADWPAESWQASVPAGRISRKAFLAKAIEPGTKVLFRFDYADGYRLERITFVVPGSFDQVERQIERQLGLPVAGDRSEARCFDPAGGRLIEDPSGVGHVIAPCTGGAIFADRRRGNSVSLTSIYDWELKDYSSRLTFGKVQLVTVEAITNCPGCAVIK